MISYWILWALCSIVGAEDGQLNSGLVVCSYWCLQDSTNSLDINSLFGQIEIGTPGQLLNIRFDLGSSAIILNSTGHYNSSASSSFIDRDYSIGREFNDGSSAQVWLANESFSIGGTTFHDMPFSQLGEFSPSTDPAYFDTYAFGGADGILGLNFYESQGFWYTYNPSFMPAVKEYLLGKSPHYALWSCDWPGENGYIRLIYTVYRTTALVGSVSSTAPSIVVISDGQTYRPNTHTLALVLLTSRSYRLAIGPDPIKHGLLFFLTTYPLSGQGMS